MSIDRPFGGLEIIDKQMFRLPVYVEGRFEPVILNSSELDSLESALAVAVANFDGGMHVCFVHIPGMGDVSLDRAGVAFLSRIVFKAGMSDVNDYHYQPEKNDGDGAFVLPNKAELAFSHEEVMCFQNEMITINADELAAMSERLRDLMEIVQFFEKAGFDSKKGQQKFLAVLEGRREALGAEGELDQEAMAILDQLLSMLKEKNLDREDILALFANMEAFKGQSGDMDQAMRKVFEVLDAVKALAEKMESEVGEVKAIAADVEGRVGEVENMGFEMRKYVDDAQGLLARIPKEVAPVFAKALQEAMEGGRREIMALVDDQNRTIDEMRSAIDSQGEMFRDYVTSVEASREATRRRLAMFVGAAGLIGVTVLSTMALTGGDDNNIKKGSVTTTANEIDPRMTLPEEIEVHLRRDENKLSVYDSKGEYTAHFESRDGIPHIYVEIEGEKFYYKLSREQMGQWRKKLLKDPHGSGDFVFRKDF